ncbi:MAG: diguanylate cyclase [bacterium]
MTAERSTRSYTSLLIQALSHLHSAGGAEDILQGFLEDVRVLLHARAVLWWRYDLRREDLVLDRQSGPEDPPPESIRLPGSRGFAQEILHSGTPQVFQGEALDEGLASSLGENRGTLTTLGIRVGSEQRPHGVMLALFPRGASLAVQEMETFQLLGSALGRSIDGSLLREELQTQVRRLLLLHDLSRILQSDRTLDECLDELVHALTRDFHAHFGYIMLYDDREERLEIRAVSGIEMEVLHDIELVPGRGITGRVFQTGLSRLVRDVSRDPDYIEGHPDVRSEMAVPIRAEGEVIGVLNLESDEPADFGPDDLRLANIIATQIGAALRQALAYEEALDRLNELELVNRITRAIATIEDLSELLNTVVGEIRSFFQTTGVGILLTPPTGEGLKISASAGESLPAIEALELKVGKGITGIVASEGKTIYLPDVTKDARYIPVDPTIRSELAVPLFQKDRVIGVLNLESDELDAYSAEDQRVVHIVATQIAQILGKALLYKEMETMAITDGLTGLYNHRQFFKRLEIEYKRSVRYSYPLSLIMVDLDYFKEFNDTFGHMRGDEALREIADLLESSVRETDVVARYGGEEFVVILPLCHLNTAREVAERIRATVEQARLDRGEGVYPLTVSVGIATAPEHASSHEEMVKRADDAMYASKRGGRNRCTVWNPDIKTHDPDRQAEKGPPR